MVKKTLLVTGSDYVLGGSGFRTSLLWRGTEGGTIISVRNANNVTLQGLAVGNHDSGLMNNAIDIHQTGGDGPSRVSYDGVFVYGMYQRQPFRQGLVFTDLGPKDVVLMPCVQGNLRFKDCAQATVLAAITFEGSIVVEGRDPRRDGFLGFQTRLATLVKHGLYLRDNHSIVMSDFYVEQAENGFVFEGSPQTPPGRATLQSPKVHFTVGEEGKADRGTAMTLSDYEGRIVFGMSQFYVKPEQVRIAHEGDTALDLVLLGGIFYNTYPYVTRGAGLRIHCVGNKSVGVVSGDGKAGGALSGITDTDVPQALPHITQALDDLRRLGALDLSLDHSQ